MLANTKKNVTTNVGPQIPQINIKYYNMHKEDVSALQYFSLCEPVCHLV